MKPKVIVIVGPTAVGKTKLSIDLAKEFNGEIISADSMQIYKEMNIGTAKPSIEEMEGIPHHLIDFLDPKENFSVAQYKELAVNYIEQIIKIDKQAIIVGGTGLYINSLIYNIDFSKECSDKEYREELQRLGEEKGNQFIYDKLKEVDSDWAQKLHPNDTKRIIRALEVYKCTGKTMSYQNSVSRLTESNYNFVIIGLDMERSLLYERINSRVDKMIKEGLICEVKELIKEGYAMEATALQGIGYKEIIKSLNGEYSFDEAVNLIKQESRRYAKRQLTWFRKIEGINWIDVTNKEYQEIVEQAKKIIFGKK